MAKINALRAPLTCSRFWQHQVEAHACHDHSQKRGKLELPRGFLHTHTHNGNYSNNDDGDCEIAIWG